MTASSPLPVPGEGRWGSWSGEAQIFGTHGVTGADEQRMVNGVFQLANVAWPRIIEQLLHRVWSEVRTGVSETSSVDLQKVVNQRQNISGTFPQRRKRYRRHMEPVVEILAESPCRHCVIQFHVCRRNQSYIDGDGLARSDTA